MDQRCRTQLGVYAFYLAFYFSFFILPTFFQSSHLNLTMLPKSLYAPSSLKLGDKTAPTGVARGQLAGCIHA